MKKSYMILTAAVVALASCTSDDVIVNNGNEDGDITGAVISFGSSNVSGQTRASLTGVDAASRLNKEFVVFGAKHSADEDGTATNDQNVFVNYKVVYDNNTVGTSETNTNCWEYVGVTPLYTATQVSPAVGSQVVKYWDYSAPSYTFTAFAGKAELEAGNVTVTKLLADPNTTSPSKFNKGYTVTATKDAKLDNMYYSDRMEVLKKDYDKPVVLTFRNFGSRVRVGFYETVPGYKVHIDNFYFDDNADAAVTTFKAMDQASTTDFKAALWNVNTIPATPASGAAVNTLTVTYNDDASGVVNQPKVTNSTVTYTATLSLGNHITATGVNLSESSVTPTWDTPMSGSSTEGQYTTVYPNEACNNPMLIRCDYTLIADDNSGETIKVKNARVVVPAAYCQWKPNFAYTYIFKISDNTNGTTGTTPTDPDDPNSGDTEGLHPITFDAVVVDVTTGNQETIETVSTNNVITYAKNSSLQGDYKAGETIYVVDEDTKNHTVITPTNIGAGATEAQVYKLSKAATESEVIALLNGSPLGITKTAVTTEKVTEVPSSDDTNMTINGVKFTPEALASGAIAEYYAYVYTKVVNVAPQYTKVGETPKGGNQATSSDYDQSTTYYFNTADDGSGVYYAASGIDTNNFATYKAKLYTKTADGTAGQYDVKVITVK